MHPLLSPSRGWPMLSSVLRSPRAIAVDIEIVRAVVQLREWIASNKELTGGRRSWVIHQRPNDSRACS